MSGPVWTTSYCAARIDSLAAEVERTGARMIAAHPALPPHAVERIARHFRAAAHEIRGVAATLAEVRAAETIPPTEGV